MLETAKEVNNTSSSFWHNNCLNTIRLLSAFSVMFFHMKTHLDIEVPFLVSVIFRLFPGVPIFFFLSGFLIWNSIEKSKNLLEYAKKRFWRIFPQLWAVKIISVIVILFTYKELTSYKSLAIYGITSGIFLLPGNPDFLNEYGCGAVNGSLWTIYITLQFYVVVYFLYKLLHKKRMHIWAVVIAISLIVGFASNGVQYIVPPILSKLYNMLLFRYFWLFALGALVSEKRDTIIPILKKYWFIFIGVAFFFLSFPRIDVRFGSYPVFFCILQLLGLTGFAYRYPKFNIKFDFSYGLYLYHMVVVNTMIEFGLTGEIKYMIIAMLVSAIVSIASEQTIGKLPIKRQNSTT